MASGLPEDQQLPPKEVGLFKQVIRMYENKQYKSSLKTCNQILKKFPNHGETLSMKGLAVNGLDGKKEEAYELVRLGLMKSKCKSHICWHVYGLLNRGDKNYDGAIKCYRNALNIEPDNQQILRDLALLQIQRMETAGLVGTRHKLLELKPAQKANWLGFALAHYLNKSHDIALRVMDTFDQTMEGAENKYEESELLLFRNMVIFDSGDYKGCLAHLDACKGKILDATAVMETKAKCYSALDDQVNAKKTYIELLNRNPENRNYLLFYVQCEGHAIKNWTDKCSDEVATQVYKTVVDVATQVPKSHTLNRIALDLASGPAFRERLIDFTKPYLKKTIPSLFSALKSLYRCPAKVEIMTEVFKEWETSLTTNTKFPDEEEEAAPSTVLWLLMLLSAHQYRKKDYEGALKYIDTAIEHTPTVEMLYILKGRILKHLGDLDAAWEAVEKARLLDTADRFLNTKATKYQLRRNKIKEAEKCIGLFTTQPDDTPSYSNIVDMQCMWYEIEEGDAYFRLGDIITAMKKWLLVDKHFQDMEEDQFDFHNYCLRKFTLRAYIDLLRFEQRAHCHKFYQKAAERVVKGYLHIFDAKQKGEDLQAKVLNLKDDTPNGAVEDKKKKKEEKKKATDDDDDDREEMDPKDAKEKEYDLAVNTEDPLGAAIPFAKDMVVYHPQKITGWILSAEIYLRKSKPLLVVKHLLGAIKVDPADATVKTLAKDLYAKVDSQTDLNDNVKTVLESYRAQLL